MSTELMILAWTVVLALVQIGAPSVLRTKQYGTDWNVSPRDADMPAPWPVTARLERAQRNLFENLPLFAIAILLVHLTHREGIVTTVGAWIFLIARVVYVPLYAFGVKYVRTLVFLVSYAGLWLVLGSVLVPSSVAHAQSRSHAQASIELVRVEGTYGQDLVMLGLHAAEDELARCATVRHAPPRTSSDRIAIDLVIDPEGRVTTQAHDEPSETTQQTFLGCARRAIESVRFERSPAPTDATVVLSWRRSADVIAVSRAARPSASGIESGPAEITGDYAAERVRTVVARRLVDLGACRQASLRRFPSLDGTIAVRFTLDPSGQVAAPSIQANDTEDPDLAPCVLGAIGSWRFAPPRTGDTVEITLPLSFRAIAAPAVAR